MPLTHCGPGARGEGRCEQGGGGALRTLRPWGWCTRSLGLEPPAAAAAPPPGFDPPPLASDPQRPGAQPRILVFRRVYDPHCGSRWPANWSCRHPGFCSLVLAVMGARSCVWDRGNSLQSQPCASRQRLSFTPRTAPDTLSRSSRQEVVPLGYSASSPRPIATRSEPKRAGQRQEREVPIGAFERSWA